MKRSSRATGRQSGEIVRRLMDRLEAYERYFKSTEAADAEGGSPGVDNEATSAYLSVLKLLCLVSGSAETIEGGSDSMKKLAEEIFEREYGLKRQG